MNDVNTPTIDNSGVEKEEDQIGNATKAGPFQHPHPEDFGEDEMEDDKENGSEEQKKTLAFINLEMHRLLKARVQDMMVAIETENSPNIRPIFAYKMGPKVLKMEFADPASRELAVDKKISIFNQKCVVERPKDRARSRSFYIYIYNLPTTEKHEDVAAFLKARLNVVADGATFRWLDHKGTKIHSGGRSVLVEVPSKTEIPGYLWYQNPKTMKRPKKISIWHPQMPVYCKKCLQKGHLSANCSSTQQIVRNSAPKSWAEIAAYPTGFSTNVEPSLSNNLMTNAVTTSTNLSHDLTDTPDDAPMDTLGLPTARKINLSKPPFSTKNQFSLLADKPSSPISSRRSSVSNSSTAGPNDTDDDHLKPKNSKRMLKNDTKQAEKLVPFFGMGDTFSNHFTCVFKVKDQVYSSTEQFLFSEKMKSVSDITRYNRIMANNTARICRSIGHEVEWPGGVDTWRIFAKDCLYVANKAKYEQNDLLRKQLLSTYPATLVECNPRDIFWGIGIDKRNRDVYDRSKWRGENAMGVLLTNLRDEFYILSNSSNEFSPEIGQATKKLRRALSADYASSRSNRQTSSISNAQGGYSDQQVQIV